MQLAQTANVAEKLDPAFSALNKARREGRDLTEEEVKAMRDATREAGNLKTAFEQSAQTANATNSEVEKLISNLKKPFGSDALTAISTEC